MSTSKHLSCQCSDLFPHSYLWFSIAVISLLPFFHMCMPKCNLFTFLRWSCVTSALPVSSVRSLFVARWLAPLPIWPRKFFWTRVITAHWTCGRSVSLCMSAWAGHFHLMRMKTSTTKFTTQPSCILPTLGNRSRVMVNTEREREREKSYIVWLTI